MGKYVISRVVYPSTLARLICLIDLFISMMLVASTVILKVWRCSITTRLFHLVSSLLESHTFVKSIESRKELMVALETDRQVGRMIM